MDLPKIHCVNFKAKIGGFKVFIFYLGVIKLV